MPEFTPVASVSTPRRQFSPGSCLLSILLLTVLAIGSAPSAKAFGDLATKEATDRLVAARSKEVLAGRATPVERIAYPLIQGLQPQQSGAALSGASRRIPGNHPALLLASLGRDNLPMSFPLDATPVPEPKGGRLGFGDTQDPANLPSLSGEPIRWLASPDCLAEPLRAVLAEVAANFGPLRVNSTCRSKPHNSRVGGAPRSYHLTGNAVDFRISGAVQPVLDFLAGKRTVGGLKHYGFGIFHIDTGPRRTWANNSWGSNKGWKKKRAGKRRRTA
jgi:hypothetical protein